MRQAETRRGMLREVGQIGPETINSATSRTDTIGLPLMVGRRATFYPRTNSRP